MSPEVMRRLRAGGEIRTGRGVALPEIRAAESILGAFPLDYQEFLEIFGWASIGPWEVFGLGQDVPSFLNLVGITLGERSESYPPLPNQLVAIHNDGAGNLYAFDTAAAAATGSSAIFFWDHELGPDQIPQEIAGSFAQQLEEFLDLFDGFHIGNHLVPLR